MQFLALSPRWLIHFTSRTCAITERIPYSFTFRLISDLDMYVLKFEDFGKNFAKKNNMSPDAFIQLVLQYTYYRYKPNWE